MSERARDTENRLEWAFILSLVGGILIVTGGLMMLFGWPFGMMGHMMMGYGAYPPASTYGYALGFAAWSGAAGAVILVGAARMRTRPASAFPWGVAIIVAGAMSLLGMGGFGIGAVAAIAGGVLAITAARPVPRSRERAV